MRRERVRSRSGIRDAKSPDDGRGEKGRLQKPKAPATVRGRYIGKAKKPARLGAGTGVPCPYTRSLWRSLPGGEDRGFGILIIIFSLAGTGLCAAFFYFGSDPFWGRDRNPSLVWCVARWPQSLLK